MDNLEGQTFAGYEIIGKLGQGGMGAVYKARQPKLDRLIALKVMATELAADPEFVARFKREASAAAALNHENIVQVFSAGECEKTHFIAMEFVEGETLRHHIESQGRLDPREAVAITVLVAQALQYAWNKARIIHRDIKPENIFLSHAGEVKVGDLGLAKTVGGGSTSLTQTGTMMGSPHYISPEQARGLSDIDFKTDIYSLGCTLYHMLTGRPPYTGTDPLVVINKHVNEPPPAIFKIWPTCPIPLALLVGKMLAKQRHERPASYDDLIEQLREVHGKLKPATAVVPVSASEPTQVLPTPAPAVPAPPTPKPAVAKTHGAKPVTRDSRLVIGGAVAAAVVLIGGLLLWSPWKARQAEPGSESRLQAESGATQPAKAGTPNAEAALKQLGNVFTNAVGAEMVYIPPGEFMMGSTKEEQAWAVQNGEKPENVKSEGEQPRKTKIKDGFWMGRTEVTVGQWKQFVNDTGYVTDAEKKGEATVYQERGKPYGPVKGKSWRDPNFGSEPQDNHPVCCVSWNDAQAFGEWLTQREQQAGRLPAGFTVRLPTETEWEYACRAGTQTRYWWGDSEKDGNGRLNCNQVAKDDGFDFLAPVDSYDARGRNQFGLADMMGNVYEWCLDGYDATQARELWLDSRGGRIARGTAFHDSPVLSRSAARKRPVSASTSIAYMGFRVCLGPDMLSSTASAVSNTPPAISNWQDVMPTVRAEMDKRSAVRHEDGWAVVTQAIPSIGISNGRLSDIAVHGRFRNNCQINLAICGPPSRSYFFNLTRGGGTLQLRRSGSITKHEDQPLATLRFSSAEEHDFLITKVGDLLSVWVDGAFAGSARDSTLTSGNANIYLYPGNAIRDLAIADLSAAASSADSALRTPQSAIAPDAGWQNAINLLPLIDPQKDAVTGSWTKQDGGLLSGLSQLQRIEIPYRPPEEYDYRIVFTRQTGAGAIYQILTSRGRPFDWCLAAGGSAGRYLGFENIDGKAAGSGPSAVLMERDLENGRRYDSVVQVRKDGVKAFLDGKFITEWKTDYRDMIVVSSMRLRDHSILGVGNSGAAVFHLIEVREVTGKGTFTRGAPAAASAGEWTTLPNGWRVGKPVNLGPTMNSAANEINPTVSGDGLTLLFFATRTNPRGDNGIWVCTRPSTTAQWDAPRWLDDALVNKRSLMRDPCLSSDGLTLIFNSIRPDGQGKEDLWISTRSSSTEPWGKAENLGPVINSECSEGQPFLSADGLTLLFRSDRPGGQGGNDIWMSTRPKIGAPWGAPLNLGPSVNCEYEDGRACLSADGLALFFASTRGGGQGRREFWMSTRRSKAEPFGQPLNLGPTVNSRYEEFSPWLSADDRTLYFHSDRPGGQGEHDLWQVPVLPPDASLTTPALQHSNSPVVWLSAFCAEVAALPAEQQVARVVAKLKELNPGFDGKEEHKIEDGVVTELAFSTVAVADISPVRALSGLKRLECKGESDPGGGLKQRGLLADLSPLRGMKLKFLRCDHNKIADLTPLAGMPLESFCCYHNYISNLEPVAGASLRHLSLSGNKISDLSPLKGTTLWQFMCHEQEVKDLSPLRGMPLNNLSIRTTSVNDLSPLRGMRLKCLNLGRTPVTDLSPLAGMPITELTCNFVPARDAKLLRSIKTLETINDLPAAEFWRKVEAGEMPKAK